MQYLHTADHPVLALIGVAYRKLCSSRTTRIIRIARMLLDMSFDIDLDKALVITTGVALVGDIGEGRNSSLYHVQCRNSSVMSNPYQTVDQADGVLLLHHGNSREETCDGDDHSFRHN